MEIIWRATAIRDLQAIREFIAQDNPDAAVRVRRNIRAAVERLAEYPNLGRAGRVAGTRELIVGGSPYIVVYRVREDTVRILAVIHAARQWPDRL